MTLFSRKTGPGPAAGRWAGILLAALLLAGGILAVRSGSPLPRQNDETRTGENRTVKLEDGSRVELNTRTYLEWSLDAAERRVMLQRGEAFFEVRPDATRPFLVQIDHSEIRVLGTRFNVYRKANGHVIVTVLEGAVRVEGHEPADWHRELYANQQLEYGAKGVVADTSTSAAAEGVTKWREGMTEFQNLPLPQVVEELSRYTDRRIVIGDSRLKKLYVLGVVSNRDVGATLRRLEKHAPVKVIEDGGTFTLTYDDKGEDGRRRGAR